MCGAGSGDVAAGLKERTPGQEAACCSDAGRSSHRLVFALVNRVVETND